MRCALSAVVCGVDVLIGVVIRKANDIEPLSIRPIDLHAVFDWPQCSVAEIRVPAAPRVLVIWLNPESSELSIYDMVTKGSSRSVAIELRQCACDSAPMYFDHI